MEEISEEISGLAASRVIEANHLCMHPADPALVVAGKYDPCASGLGHRENESKHSSKIGLDDTLPLNAVIFDSESAKSPALVCFPK